MINKAKVLLCVALCVSTAAQAKSADPDIALAKVLSGQAVLHQNAYHITLTMTPKTGAVQTIALAHECKFPTRMDVSADDLNQMGQCRYAEAYATKLIAEVPGQFLIFTDKLASNVNVQGGCGASETGETYLHVVSLVPPMHETLSALIESCWLSMFDDKPIFDKKTRMLTVALDFADHYPSRTLFSHIAADGSVAE